MALTFIDLGLPSGKLWADQNEVGYFTFDEAVKKFGDDMPSSDDFDELYENCQWDWNYKRHGYTVTGPNGNNIFLPASGWNYPGLECVGSAGYYWSRTAYDAQRARKLDFWPNHVSSSSYYLRYYGFSVRLCKTK